jgi:hypothetical protein
MKINIDLKNKHKHYYGYITKNISSTDEYEEGIFEFIVLLRKKPVIIWLTENKLKNIEDNILSIVNTTSFTFKTQEHDLNDKVSVYLNNNDKPPVINDN